MEISSLFSHPEVPEVISSDETSSQPVENPTFSDRPDGKSSQPSSS
jgi:hypothetical protein